jgi:hypothetical protein
LRSSTPRKPGRQSHHRRRRNGASSIRRLPWARAHSRFASLYAKQHLGGREGPATWLQPWQWRIRCHCAIPRGYALQVGSANSVSAFRHSLAHNREPLALTIGVARPLEKSRSEHHRDGLYNQAGRFVAEGLAPGIWLIEMATDERPTIYRIEVRVGRKVCCRRAS